MARHRIALLILSLFTLGILIAGCSGTPAATNNPPAQQPGSSDPSPAEKFKDPVTVHLWSWRPQDKPIWEKVQEKLQAQGKNITIEFRGVKSTDYNAVMQTALAGGEGPDIFATRAGAGTRSMAEAKQILPLTGIDLSGFDEVTLSAVSSEGQVYAVPFAVQTLTYFYNKAIFDQHGLQEPKTWDELITLMESLKAKGITPLAVGAKDAYAVSFLIDTAWASHLGDQWTQDVQAGKTTFQDPNFVALLEKAKTLSKYAQPNFMASSQRDARTLFGTGQAAMIVDGIWAVNAYYLQTDPNIKLGSFLAPPLKAGESPRLSSYVDGGYGVVSNTKVKDAALEVIAFIASDEFAQMYADQHNEIPANKNAKFPDSAPMLQRAVQQKNEFGLKVPMRIGGPLDDGTPSFSTSLGANLQGMLAGQLTPAQAAEAIQKDVASWYAPFKK